MPSLTPADFYNTLVDEVSTLRGMLADGDLEAAVPGCPGWTLADVGAHIGGVYRFATVALTEHRAVDEPAGPRERDALLSWFDTGADGIVAALQANDWDAACLTFAPPATTAFWARRMCHETRLHRFDAESSQQAASPIPAVLAADGVDEIVTMFFPRQVRLGRIAPLDHTIELQITDAAPLLLGADGVTVPDAAAGAITGNASDVLLLLWKRAALDDLDVTVTGDERAVRAVLSAALTP